MMGKIASRELKLLAAMNNSQGVEVKVGDQYNEQHNVGGKLTKERASGDIIPFGLGRTLYYISLEQNIDEPVCE